MLSLRGSRSVNKLRPLTAGKVAKLLRRKNYTIPFVTLFKVSDTLIGSSRLPLFRARSHGSKSALQHCVKIELRLFFKVNQKISTEFMDSSKQSSDIM